MKQLSKTEKASIMDCAPAYFEYLLAQGADTCLAKILGVFQARIAMSRGNWSCHADIRQHTGVARASWLDLRAWLLPQQAIFCRKLAL